MTDSASAIFLKLHLVLADCDFERELLGGPPKPFVGVCLRRVKR